MRAAMLFLLAAAVARADVTILRDGWGVPHVFTRGPDALVRGAYADGWAQAEDRLFEMEVLRRAATGVPSRHSATGSTPTSARSPVILPDCPSSSAERRRRHGT